jgi:hypothetical protein
MLPRRHNRYIPRDEDAPVIILQIGEKAALLDGHTRVNKWMRERAIGLRRVVVLRPRDEALNGATKT